MKFSHTNLTGSCSNNSFLDKKPELVIQASAVGYYGMENRKEICSEQSAPGKDFLAGLCVAWEKQLEPLQKHMRVCTPRLGVVLGWGGGAFTQLWELYANGLGAQLSNGQQWMNWIHLDDVVHFFETVIDNSHYNGAYNLVSPGNISQQTMHKELCRRSASLNFMKSPALALRIILGESEKILTRVPH